MSSIGGSVSIIDSTVAVNLATSATSVGGGVYSDTNLLGTQTTLILNSTISGNTGASNHLAGEMLKALAGINIVRVPYKGGGAVLNDLVGGQIQMAFLAGNVLMPQMKAGKLRGLAVTSATRSEALPELPTIGDFLPGYEATFMLGLGAPKNTPAEIVDRLNKESNAAVADPGTKARLAELGTALLQMTSTDFGKLLADETEKWGKVIRAANIKPE